MKIMLIIFLQGEMAAAQSVLDFIKPLFFAILIFIMLVIVLKAIGKLIEKRNKRNETK